MKALGCEVKERKKFMIERSKHFCRMRQELEAIYDDYARTIGISYTTLFILNLISQYEDCTQKIICEKTMLPKQTVNNVIKKLLDQGYIQLETFHENQKTKKITFTENGKQYAEPLIQHIQTAECEAMNHFSKSHQKEFIKLMKQYVLKFRDAMQKKESV